MQPPNEQPIVSLDFLRGLDVVDLGLRIVWKLEAASSSKHYSFREYYFDSERPKRHAELAGVQCDVGDHHCVRRIIQS